MIFQISPMFETSILVRSGTKTPLCPCFISSLRIKKNTRKIDLLLCIGVSEQISNLFVVYLQHANGDGVLMGFFPIGRYIEELRKCSKIDSSIFWRAFLQILSNAVIYHRIRFATSSLSISKDAYIKSIQHRTN